MSSTGGSRPARTGLADLLTQAEPQRACPDELSASDIQFLSTFPLQTTQIFTYPSKKNVKFAFQIKQNGTKTIYT